MKFTAGIVMLIFVFFLSTPTIVSLIERSTDTSVFFSMTEEEISHKEIKADYVSIDSYSFINLSGLTSGLIHSENLSKHDNVFSSIFIPPPETI